MARCFCVKKCDLSFASLAQGDGPGLEYNVGIQNLQLRLLTMARGRLGGGGG